MTRAVPEKSPATRRHPAHAIVNFVGVIVLLSGLACAALIFVLAPEDGSSNAAQEITRGRMYQRDIALVGGKGALYATRFGEWFADLWHGRELSYTIAVLAAAVALACFWLARLMSVPAPGESDEEGRRT